MILLIDNYDSFSYNLYQLIGEIDPDIKVIRNDEMTIEQIRELKPDRIILSPGPGDKIMRSGFKFLISSTVISSLRITLISGLISPIS